LRHALFDEQVSKKQLLWRLIKNVSRHRRDKAPEIPRREAYIEVRRNAEE
jgi:hypothetical protein